MDRPSPTAGKRCLSGEVRGSAERYGALGRHASFHWLAAALVAVTILLVGPSARADGPRLHVNWERVLEDGDAWLRGSPRGDLSPLRPHKPIDHIAARSRARGLDLAPHTQVVLRDWGSSLKLTGEKLSMTDLVKLSRSTRMVLGRISFGHNRFVPFAQTGLGQWRIDPAISALLPYARRMATSVGIGAEYTISRRLSASFETNMTVLVREQRADNDHPQPHLFTSLVALRVRL